VDDPDAIWKPGYDGPPPIVDAPRARAAAPPPEDAEPTEPAEQHKRRWRLGVGVGVGIGLVLVAAVVVVDPLDSAPAVERPDGSVFGGPASRRLPDDAAPLWTVDLASAGDHRVDVIGRELVVASVATVATEPTATMVALDATSGEQRWTLQVPGDLREVTVIGAVGDVLVLEQPGAIGPTVTGVDVVTGATRWVTDAVANDGHLGLVGTPFVARLPSSPDRLVTLIDAATGREVGTIASESAAPGRPGGWSTDGAGTWYVIDDGQVVAHDLRSELGDARPVGPLADVALPAVVVDDRLAVVDDSGSIAIAGGDPVTVSPDVPGSVRSLTPVSGSNLVVTAPGRIAGVDVDGDTVDLAWSRNDGVVAADHPTVDGMLLQVATRGGAGNQLVDGRTGETVEQLTMVPGALQALVVAGDGFVVLRTDDLGAKLAGVDLDGTERWSIAGSVPVVVGDRIVARATSPSAQQLRITAHGDVE
jgi:outer membrane protein assembly factor BamB